LKKICLITPGHISSDPRLIKEADTLSKNGYKVHLIFTQYMPYLIQDDNQILRANPDWTFDFLNWSRLDFRSKINRIKSGFLKEFEKHVPVNRFSNSYAIYLNRNYSWQLRKAIAQNADLYIAHNLGALPVAVNAAKKTNAKSGFDGEDFHRNELSDDQNDADVKLNSIVEQKYIPYLSYFTAASPGIATKYAGIFKREVTTIVNVFPKITIAKIIHNHQRPLRLFWFSQTIGPNRGIETIIEAVSLSNLTVELHLLGNVGKKYISKLEQLLSLTAKRLLLTLHAPISPEEVFNLAATFDIGIASEQRTPLNRDICLTNKLFTYIQCGLAIAVSSTSAQKDFIEKYPGTGKLYHDAAELAQILTLYDQQRDSLHQTKENNYQLGQDTLNWENESKKFLNQIEICLTQ